MQLYLAQMLALMYTLMVTWKAMERMLSHILEQNPTEFAGITLVAANS